MHRKILCATALFAAAAAQQRPPHLRAAKAKTEAAAPLLEPLTESHCRRSRSLQGDLELVARFAPKLECRRGPLKVVVLGGSVTHGSHTFDRFVPEGHPAYDRVRQSPCFADPGLLLADHACGALTFGHVLEERLNEAFPCDARHRVHRFPRKGEGSEFHVQVLRQCRDYLGRPEELRKHSVGSQDPEVCERLYEADVVLLDTAVNDQEDAGRGAELLARELHRLPNKPAPYWIVSSIWWRHWGGSRKPLEPPYYGDHSGQEQARVLSYYGLPQISVLEAIAPDMTRAAGRELWQPFWSQDAQHPSAWGHAILADLILCNLRRDLWDHIVQQRPKDRPNVANFLDQDLPEPWMIDAADEGYFFEAADLRQAAVVDKVAVAGEGFALGEDVEGRPGLLATTVGSSVVLQPLPEQRAHSGCELALTYLISYEHMGILEADVLLGPQRLDAADGGAESKEAWAGPVECPATDLDEAAEPAFTTRIDTLLSGDERQVSIAREHHFPFVVPKGVSCAWLRIRVVAADDRRRESKIKLLRFTTACPVDPDGTA